jgi:hypothetical protein
MTKVCYLIPRDLNACRNLRQTERRQSAKGFEKSAEDIVFLFFLQGEGLNQLIKGAVGQDFCLWSTSN